MQALFQFDLRGSDYATELGGSVADVCRTELLASGASEDDDDLERSTRHEDSVESGKAALPKPPRRKLNSAEREIVDFATRLVEGTLEHRDAIDVKLQSVTRNWDLRRMAIVDRNVLRMSVYELMFCKDVPPKVAINEAIEIGKKFSTANSGGFVNGILDRIRIDLEKGPEVKEPEATESGQSAGEQPTDQGMASDAS